MIIRPEQKGDEDIIHTLTETAFAPQAFSDGTEPSIIRGLRAAGDLTLSLVAEDGGDILGHVAFSKVTIGGVHGGWFGLGPVSVWPDHQSRGIGQALINKGLATMKDRGAKGCALLGAPAYYSRFGFRNNGPLTYHSYSARVIHALAFDGEVPVGELRFCDAFEETEGG